MRRKLRRLRIILLLVGVIGVLSLGQATQGLFQGVQAHTLDNGLQVLLVSRPGAPVTAVDMWVDTGSINESPEDNGISHFFEHMLFKGTEERPQGIDREIEGLGGRTNAGTSYDWTHYYILLPSPHTDVALEVMADITRHSTFPPEEIAREKQVVLRELDQRSDNPRQFLFFTLRQQAYQVHPYGLPIIGTEESLERLTREDLLDYMKRYYAPNNMVLVVVGDIDPERTLRIVREAFADMAPQELPPREYPPEPARAERAVVEVPRDIRQGYLAFSWPAPSIRQPEDVYAMDVLLAVLSEGRGSRFYRTLIKQLGLATGVDAGFFTQKEPGLFTVYAEFPYENRRLVERILLSELRRILDGQITPQEVERAKTVTLANYALSAETAAGLAATLGFYAIVAGDYRFALTYPEGIRRVTAEDVVEVARRYIDLDRYLEVVLVPQDLAEAPLAEALTLSNGVRLILKEDHASEVVALQAFVGTGLRAEPPEKAGLAALTERMLLKGTAQTAESAARTEEEIFEEIENLGARLDYGVLADMAYLSLVATGDTLDRALPVFLDVLLAPAFPEAELQGVKDEVIKEIQAASDSNFTVIYDNFQSALYGDHPYGRPTRGTTEAVQSLTRQDVVDFYERYYVPNNLVVTAVGDFDTAELLAALRERLGGLPVRPESAAWPPEPQPVAFDLTESRQVVAEKRSNLVWLVLGYPGPAVGSPDYPAMKLLNAVIGGGSSARLYTEIRDKRGLVYSTGSFFPSRREDSHLVTYFIALPQNVDAALEQIRLVIQDIQKNGVPAEELERAKNYVIGNYLMDHETAERRAWYLGWYETLGVGSSMDERYPELIREVSSEDLQRVAQEYLKAYVVSRLGPPEPSE